MTRGFGESVGITRETAYRLLEELELNQPENVSKVRSKRTRVVKAEVVVRPGNVCDRDTSAAHGTTRELSRHTLTGMFDRPITVGSIFWISFDRGVLDLPPRLVAARAARCSTSGCSKPASPSSSRWIRRASTPVRAASDRAGADQPVTLRTTRSAKSRRTLPCRWLTRVG